MWLLERNTANLGRRGAGEGAAEAAVALLGLLFAREGRHDVTRKTGRVLKTLFLSGLADLPQNPFPLVFDALALVRLGFPNGTHLGKLELKVTLL